MCGIKASFNPKQQDAMTQAVKDAATSLRERGWAVIEGVLTPEECEQYVDSVWGWLEGLGTGIDRQNPDTWGDDRWPPSFRGIINTLEVAHQDCVWRVRSHPRILQVFEALWGTNELLSSFDSINILRPGEHESCQDSWLHVDQAPLRRGCTCIQGLVNMVDVGPENGTLLLKDGSHRHHQNFFETESILSQREKEKTEDFYQFADAERPFWQRFPNRALSAPKGSLFLWDSRTAHQNLLPAHTDTWRHVVYCCYQPRKLATPEDLWLKQHAYKKRRHIRLFPVLGESYHGSQSDSETANMVDQPEKCFLKGTGPQKHANDIVIQRLAGMQPYNNSDIVNTTPLIDFVE
eukprot:jgi/Astpho2/9117/Aster-x0373